MKKTIILLLLTISLSVSYAQKNYLHESKADKDKRMAWWRNSTFGMFIHWGLYSVPAGMYEGKEAKGIGEWILHSANIPLPIYETYAKLFNPVKFDAKKWVQIAKNAGVKYIVITSKHHDGFALWNSKVTSWDIMDATPFHRDILKELSAACREAGIKFCTYHSIMDWHQPDADSKKDYDHQKTENPNWEKYREGYLKPQLTEIVKNYNPAVLWFDGEWIPEWTELQGKDLYNFLRNQNPNLIINNRVGKGRDGMKGMNKGNDYAGDFGTPEQEILEGTSDQDWESCMTMNDTWGFKTNDHNWKTAQNLIDNLVDIAAKGGNYLLNVGPTSEGLIPAESVERLSEMGKWLRINGEAIYATNSLKKYKEGDNIKFTTKGQYVYAIANKFRDNSVIINSLSIKKGSQIVMLGVPTPLKYKANEDGSITINVPKKLPCNYAWTFKIEAVAK
jgi:alpha-L-fucosidase